MRGNVNKGTTKVCKMVRLGCNGLVVDPKTVCIIEKLFQWPIRVIYMKIDNALCGDNVYIIVIKYLKRCTEPIYCSYVWSNYTDAVCRYLKIYPFCIRVLKMVES